MLNEVKLVAVNPIKGANRAYTHTNKEDEETIMAKPVDDLMRLPLIEGRERGHKFAALIKKVDVCSAYHNAIAERGWILIAEAQATQIRRGKDCQCVWVTRADK